MATRFILRLRLSTEHHYAFKPSPSLKRVEFPLNEQIFNTIGINCPWLKKCEFLSKVQFFENISTLLY
ncbi:hypothetical protein [Shewanella sp. Koi 1]